MGSHSTTNKTQLLRKMYLSSPQGSNNTFSIFQPSIALDGLVHVCLPHWTISSLGNQYSIGNIQEHQWILAEYMNAKYILASELFKLYTIASDFQYIL